MARREIKYDVSANGTQREDQLRKELETLLHLQSVSCAKRRQSQTVDESDFEHGFRQLVGRKKVDFARQCISAVLFLLAGGGASWAVNAYMAVPPGATAHWACASAIACGLLAAFVQHWPGWD